MDVNDDKENLIPVKDWEVESDGPFIFVRIHKDTGEVFVFDSDGVVKTRKEGKQQDPDRPFQINREAKYVDQVMWFKTNPSMRTCVIYGSRRY